MTKKIKYYPESSNLDEFSKIVDSGNGLAGFVIEALNFEELKTISDQKITLPPKSTWIEPKLRSAITIYSLR